MNVSAKSPFLFFQRLESEMSTADMTKPESIAGAYHKTWTCKQADSGGKKMLLTAIVKGY